MTRNEIIMFIFIIRKKCKIIYKTHEVDLKKMWFILLLLAGVVITVECKYDICNGKFKIYSSAKAGKFYFAFVCCTSTALYRYVKSDFTTKHDIKGLSLFLIEIGVQDR